MPEPFEEEQQDLENPPEDVSEVEPEIPPEIDAEAASAPQLPPRGSKEWKTYWYNKRNERINNLETGLTEMKSGMEEIKNMLRQNQQQPPMQRQMPHEEDELEAYAKKKGLDSQSLRELTEVIGKRIERDKIDPAVRPLYGNMISQEEKDLMGLYKDKETGYSALKPLVDQFRQRYPGATLTTAYAMVSRPLVEEKMSKLTESQRSKVVDKKSAMSEGMGRSMGETQELTLSPEQRTFARRTFQDEIESGKITAADAEKKYLDAIKRRRAQETVNVPR